MKRREAGSRTRSANGCTSGHCCGGIAVVDRQRLKLSCPLWRPTDWPHTMTAHANQGRVSMFHRLTALVLLSSICTFTLAQDAPKPATQPADPPQPIAASKLVAVTVYQGSALVTREVEVPEGQNLVEVIVSPLPEQTVDSSLY